KLDYKRLPGFEDIERNDVVVFNYPMDADAPLSRPVDKRENYIKRCIAIGGDTLKIVNSQVFVNGKAESNPPESETTYYVKTNGTDLNPQTLFDMRIDVMRQSETEYVFTMTQAQSEIIAAWQNVEVVKANVAPENAFDSQVFPHSSAFPWNVDNYGPIIVPKEGWTVKLDSTTVPIYERAISVYEGNVFEERADGYYINSQKADSYTFKMDYYWMMGDNRHSSADSCLWGLVTDVHIVGMSLFVCICL